MDHAGRMEILDFVKRMCVAIIDSPEKLNVGCQIGEQTTVYSISVHKDDLGKIIGKKGQNIGSIRTLVNALATKHSLRVVVEVEE